MKVVQQLGERDWVETVRGCNGALRLGEQTLAVTIGGVVRVTESDFALSAICRTGKASSALA